MQDFFEQPATDSARAWPRRQRGACLTCAAVVAVLASCAVFMREEAPLPRREARELPARREAPLTGQPQQRAAVAAAAGASAALTSPAPVDAPEMELLSLTSVDPSAVCFDGSPAGYYWKASANGSSVWIVYFEGGGWCYSEESCSERCGGLLNESSLCSSNLWPQRQQVSGLLSPATESMLQDANKAFVRYCTGDAHMGDAEAFGYQFRGARVVKAVIADLQQRHGLGQAEGRRSLLIFGGGSAGARGAMVNIDYVPAMLGAAAHRVDVIGFLDSPYWIDVPTPSFSNFSGFASQCQQVHANFNVPHLGRACLEAYPEAERWKCLMGQYRMPHLELPYFMVASSYDSFQLEQIVGHRPNTSEEKRFAEALANLTVQHLQELRAYGPANASRSNAVYSWACYNHCLSLTRDGFDTLTCGAGGDSMDSAFLQFLSLAGSRWLFRFLASQPPRLEWMERCTGFDCGAGCPLDLFTDASRGKGGHSLGEAVSSRAPFGTQAVKGANLRSA